MQDTDGDDLTNYQEIVTYAWLGLDPGNANTHSPTHPDYLFVYWQKVINEVSGYLNEPLAPDPDGIELDTWGNYPLLSSISKPPSNDSLDTWLVNTDNNNDGSPDGFTALLAYLSSSGSPFPPPGRQTPTDYDGDGLPDVWEWRFRPQIDMWKADGGGHPAAPLPPLPKTPELNEFEGSVPNPEEAFAAAWHDHQVLQTQRARIDSDGDGLSNLAEYTQGTHPFIADTDGDGVNDGEELAYGSNPTSANSLPPVVLSRVSGDQQMIGHLATATHPLIVRATRAGKPLAGAQVQFTADGSEGVSLSAVPTESWQPNLPLATQADGTIGVRIKAGSVTTTATITAQAVSGAAVTFSLEVRELTDPLLLAYLAQQGGGVQPGIDPMPEPDPTEVRLMTRTRSVAIAPEYLGPSVAGAIEIQTGPNDEKKGWFVPESVMSFETQEEHDDFWFNSVSSDPDWGAGDYIVTATGSACVQGDLLGNGTGGGFSVTLGTRTTAIGAGWWYGSSWGRGIERDVQRLESSQFVTVAIETAGTVGTVTAVLARFEPLLDSLAPLQTNNEQHYRELPPRSEAPFFVESQPLAHGYVAQLTVHLQSAHASEMALGVTSQARVITGEWHECWVARRGAGLPEQELTFLRVTERIQDAQGNPLVPELDQNGVPLPGTGPQVVCIERVVFSIPENGKYATTSTVTTLSGTPLITSPPPTGNNSNGGDNESNGSIFLRPNEIGVKVSLLPIEVRDGDRVLTSLPLNEDPWTNANLQKQVADSSIAWITGNTGFADTPEMPKLNARISGGAASMNVRWRFECEYKRGNGYRQGYVADFTRPEDKVGIPYRHGGGYTEDMPASQEWKIYEHSKWTQELNQNGFFGGLAKLFLKMENQPEMEVCRFRIGGRNPDEVSAKSYINSQAGATYWYAYAVAKHETFGRVPGRFYNQFYTDHQPAGGRIGDNANDMGWAAWAKACPLYNLDRSYNRTTGYRQNGPGGYGMFQVTLGPKSPDGDETSEGFIARKEIWNWQENCNRAIGELQGKLPAAQGLQNGLTNTYSQWGALPARGRLSGLEAITVTYYNGTAGLPSRVINGSNRRTPWTPESRRQGGQTTRFWQFHENVNDYCQHINQHIE